MLKLRFVWVNGQYCVSVQIQTCKQPWAEVNELFLFPFVLSVASSVWGSVRMQTGLKTM